VSHDEALPTIVWNLALCKANLGEFDRAYDLALQYGRFRAGGDDQKLLQQIESVRQGLVGESADATTPKTSEEASALFDKASASLKAEQFEDAKRMFETLLSSPIKHNQALPTIVWNLALCRAHLGDFDGARRLALTYTQYRGTEDDERKLFVQIEQLQRAGEASQEPSPATVA
jgi:thioredoxin-like negative regulator of GroEL